MDGGVDGRADRRMGGWAGAAGAAAWWFAVVCLHTVTQSWLKMGSEPLHAGRRCLITDV